MTDTLGSLADAIYAKTQEIGEADEVAKTLRSDRQHLENRLMELMKEAGTDIVRGQVATCSISESTVPKIDDFDALEKFVYRKKLLRMFHRRLSANVVAELQEQMGRLKIPGLSTFTLEKINTRKKG